MFFSIGVEIGQSIELLFALLSTLIFSLKSLNRYFIFYISFTFFPSHDHAYIGKFSRFYKMGESRSGSFRLALLEVDSSSPMPSARRRMNVAESSFPTEPFVILKLQNQSYDVPEQ